MIESVVVRSSLTRSGNRGSPREEVSSPSLQAAILSLQQPESRLRVQCQRVESQRSSLDHACRSYIRGYAFQSLREGCFLTSMVPNMIYRRPGLNSAADAVLFLSHSSFCGLSLSKSRYPPITLLHSCGDNNSTALLITSILAAIPKRRCEPF